MRRLATGLTVCVIAIAAGLGLDVSDSRPAPALPIDLYAKPGSVCSGKASELNTRRAFFLSAASAYAKTLDDPATSQWQVSEATIDLMRFDLADATAEANALFNSGLAVAMGFNHDAALELFVAAQAADRSCAMCVWGEAYVLGSDINAPIMPDQAGRARAAAEHADALADDGTVGKALASALLSRFDMEDGAVVKKPLDYAEAMAEAAAAFPDDRLVRTLAAEAMMLTQPWDYWMGNGNPKGLTPEALALLESVLADDPDYPPAIHLYIHLVEASTDPERALDYAERLAVQPAELGHLVHMPTHIHYVLGDWRASVEQNKLAIAADEAYLAGQDVSLFYQYGYYPHNIHFGLSSAQMGGDAMFALAMADKLAAAMPEEMAAVAPWIELAEAAPYYAAVQFSPPADVVAMPQPAGTGDFRKAAWHYARGHAFARQGQPDLAQEEVFAIRDLMEAPGIVALDDQFIPASTLLEISSLIVEARAVAATELPLAIELMQEAGQIEDTLPYFEPSLWYYPTGQTLGGLYLQAGELDEAEMAFLDALAEAPNNAYVLAGLHAVYEQKGDTAAAKRAQALFDKAWLGEPDAQIDLAAL